MTSTVLWFENPTEKGFLNPFVPRVETTEIDRRESRAPVHLSQSFNGLNTLIGLDRRLLTVWESTGL